MITVSKAHKGLIAGVVLPALPVLTREDVGPDYPADAPLPVAAWRVALACGDGGGSWGQGATLAEAVANAAREGWTPVRAFKFGLAWDRVWTDSAGKWHGGNTAWIASGPWKGWADFYRAVDAPSTQAPAVAAVAAL